MASAPAPLVQPKSDPPAVSNDNDISKKQHKQYTQDSDSDSVSSPVRTDAQPKNPKEADVFAAPDDSDSDSDSDGEIIFNPNNFPKNPSEANHDDDSDDDSSVEDPFASAKKMYQNDQIRAEKRNKIEEKRQKDADDARKKRAEEIVVIQEQARILKKQEEEQKEKEILEEAEKKEKAREELRKAREFDQEVDLDEQRKFMDECYDDCGGGSGSNSPSSDFGF